MYLTKEGIQVIERRFEDVPSPGFLHPSAQAFYRQIGAIELAGSPEYVQEQAQVQITELSEKVNSKTITLRESIIWLLAHRPGEVVLRSQVREALWGEFGDEYKSSLGVHLQLIRDNHQSRLPLGPYSKGLGTGLIGWGVQSVHLTQSDLELLADLAKAGKQGVPTRETFSGSTVARSFRDRLDRCGSSIELVAKSVGNTGKSVHYNYVLARRRVAQQSGLR